MAGPCVSILLKTPISLERESCIRNAISALADNVEGDDFWVQREPFLIYFGFEYEEELQEYQSGGLPEKIGWIPQDKVGFCAGCNSSEGHRILGELCLYFTRLLNGFIDFGGVLLPLDDSQLSNDLRTQFFQQLMSSERMNASTLDTFEHAYNQLLKGTPGKAFTYRYEISEQEEFISLCGDDIFMEAWLQNPYFHMVK